MSLSLPTPTHTPVTITSNVAALRGQRPLWKLFAVECVPQHAFFDVHQDGYVHFGYARLGENHSAPLAVAWGVIRRIPVPNDLSTKQYQEFFEAISENLATLVAGMGVRWNGHDHVGTLTEDASEALESIRGAVADMRPADY